MVLLSVDATLTQDLSSAAAGGEGPAPTLDRVSVQAPTEAFSIEPPSGARCEEDGSGSGHDPAPGPRTGADHWRWHGFMINAGRDPSDLRFSAMGPGDDYDATDGDLTAALLTAQGDGIWQMLPALKPEGLINPDELGGLLLDPSVYTLTDGEYLLGFACTDDTLATRQWWALTVTVQTAGGPFLVAEGQSGAGRTPGGAVRVPVGGDGEDQRELRLAGSESSPPGEPGESVSGADAAAVASAPVPPGADQGAPASSAEAVAAVVSPEVDGGGRPTGVSWTAPISFVGAPGPLPIGAWAVLAVTSARIAYLLAIPVRVLSPAIP